MKRFSYRQIPWLTSFPSTLTVKKFLKMKFSADKIHYNFSQENPKITNGVRGTLMKNRLGKTMEKEGIDKGRSHSK